LVTFARDLDLLKLFQDGVCHFRLDFSSSLFLLVNPIKLLELCRGLFLSLFQSMNIFLHLAIAT